MKDRQIKGTEKPAEKNAGYQGTIHFPDEIFSLLPKQISTLLLKYNNKRHRDVLFFSLLISLSAVIRNIFGYYHSRKVYTSLYGIVCAPPASGKNTMLTGKTVIMAVHQHKRDEHEEDVKTWKENFKKGPKPKEKVFVIPADTTRAGAMSLLSASPFGIIIESEADGLRIMLESAHGNWSDLLRKAFHHEPISSFRKTDDEYFEITNVQLSVLLSGTPDQIPSLLKTAGSGLLSRLLFYVFEEDPKFDNPFSLDNQMLEKCIKELGDEILQMHLYLSDKEEREFSLSPPQILKFNERFPNTVADYYDLAGSEGVGVALRLGLIFFRIAMILTTLRKFNQDDLQCSDDDFDLTCKIIDVLSEHSVTILSTLPEKDEMFSSKAPEIIQWLDFMPDQFTTAKWVSDCAVRGYGMRQAKRFLHQLYSAKKLVAIKQGLHQKLK